MGNFPHSLPAYLISFEKFHLLPFLSSNAVDQMQSVPHDESQCRKMSASGRSSVPDIELDQFQFTMSVLHPAVEATWTQCFRQQVPEETPFLASIYLLCVWLKIMSEERSFLFFFFAWGVFFFYIFTTTLSLGPETTEGNSSPDQSYSVFSPHESGVLAFPQDFLTTMLWELQVNCRNVFYSQDIWATVL